MTKLTKTSTQNGTNLATVYNLHSKAPNEFGMYRQMQVYISTIQFHLKQ